jgi:DNA-binding NarL/FixJ family response regulator
MHDARVRNVVVVDDHSTFRTLARELLEEIGYRVVGEAATARDALRAVRRLKPDLVLLDVQLPDRDGLSVAAELTSSPAAPAVLLVSARDAGDFGPRLSSCGAIGFIAKADLSAGSLISLLGR